MRNLLLLFLVLLLFALQTNAYALFHKKKEAPPQEPPPQEEVAHVHTHAEHEHGGTTIETTVTAPAPTDFKDLDISPVKRKDGITELNNKVCPVSGKPVSGKHFHEHNGVNYGLCCDMCRKDFLKAPEKYALPQETINAALSK